MQFRLGQLRALLKVVRAEKQVRAHHSKDQFWGIWRTLSKTLLLVSKEQLSKDTLGLKSAVYPRSWWKPKPWKEFALISFNHSKYFENFMTKSRAHKRQNFSYIYFLWGRSLLFVTSEFASHLRSYSFAANFIKISTGEFQRKQMYKQKCARWIRPILSCISPGTAPGKARSSPGRNAAAPTSPERGRMPRLLLGHFQYFDFGRGFDAWSETTINFEIMSGTDWKFWPGSAYFRRRSKPMGFLTWNTRPPCNPTIKWRKSFLLEDDHRRNVAIHHIAIQSTGGERGRPKDLRQPLYMPKLYKRFQK